LAVWLAGTGAQASPAKIDIADCDMNWQACMSLFGPAHFNNISLFSVRTLE
jgi:hypothetical protein